MREKEFLPRAWIKRRCDGKKEEKSFFGRKSEREGKGKKEKREKRIFWKEE